MTPVSAGAKMACVVVDLENPVSTDSVTIKLGTNPSNGVLSGTLTQDAVAGVATFKDLSISVAGNGYTLIATAPQQKNQFQPGAYYNVPPSGDIGPQTTLINNNPHADIPRAPITTSVTCNPFNVV
jgi:hypothetical protein